MRAVDQYRKVQQWTSDGSKCFHGILWIEQISVKKHKRIRINSQINFKSDLAQTNRYGQTLQTEQKNGNTKFEPNFKKRIWKFEIKHYVIILLNILLLNILLKWFKLILKWLSGYKPNYWSNNRRRQFTIYPSGTTLTIIYGWHSLILSVISNQQLKLFVFCIKTCRKPFLIVGWKVESDVQSITQLTFFTPNGVK